MRRASHPMADEMLSMMGLSSGEGGASDARADMRESIMNQLIDEEALGVVFEMHRAIKLGYYALVYPDDRYVQYMYIRAATGL